MNTSRGIESTSKAAWNNNVWSARSHFRALALAVAVAGVWTTGCVAPSEHWMMQRYEREDITRKNPDGIWANSRGPTTHKERLEFFWYADQRWWNNANTTQWNTPTHVEVPTQADSQFNDKSKITKLLELLRE